TYTVANESLGLNDSGVLLYDNVFETYETKELNIKSLVEESAFVIESEIDMQSKSIPQIPETPLVSKIPSIPSVPNVSIPNVPKIQNIPKLPVTNPLSVSCININQSKLIINLGKLKCLNLTKLSTNNELSIFKNFTEKIELDDF